MTGEEERHRLVAHLLVAHGAPVGVARGEEEAQEVAALGAAAGHLGATFGDEAVDDRVELDAPAPATEVSRRGDNWRHRDERAESGDGVLHHLGERFPYRRRVGLHLGVEERLPDDLQRETHERLGGVERLPIAPLVDRPPRPLGHGVGVGRDPLVGERGGDEPPLLGVELVLAREQPVAEERPEEDREAERLHERVGLRLEHLLRDGRCVLKTGVKSPTRITAMCGCVSTIRSCISVRLPRKS